MTEMYEDEEKVEATDTASTAVSHAQHTALPWRAVDDGEGESDCWRIDPAMQDDGMASGYRWFSEDDAKFLVRACNHHEALLAALKTLVYVAPENPFTLRDPRYNAWPKLLADAHAVVAKVEGK